jgi:hypothetical protein
LEYANETNPHLLWIVSAMIAGVLGSLAGITGLVLVVVIIPGSFVILWLIASVEFHLSPPKAQLHIKHGSSGLRLKDGKK